MGHVAEHGAALVADEGAGEGAQFEQAMPVGVVARQPGYLESEDDPGAAQADLGDEPLEAFAVGRARARLALVAVDGDDLLGQPAERHGALA